MRHRSPTLLLFHVVWATARRRPMLEPGFDDALIRILGDKARDLGCSLLAAGCAADHVHAVGRLAPTVSLATLIGRMKGGSAFDIRHAAKELPVVVWQEGYWAQSLDPSTLDGVARYVRDQRQRHDPSHPAELWQESELAKSIP
jgi:putative transposase